MMNHLTIKKLTVISLDGQELLKNIDLNAQQGDSLCIYGPNGAGKSSLLKTIMHHYNVKITGGDVLFNNKSLKKLDTCEIAKLGFFHMQQNPPELNGVQTLGFLRLINGQNPHALDFPTLFTQINKDIVTLNLPDEILKREVNVDFSGGQKKKIEIVQAKVFQPTVLLIDEIDSGLDVDAIKKITSFINKKRRSVITLTVSHNLNFIKAINPNKVFILYDKKIVKQGSIDLIEKIEKKGFDSIITKEKKSTRPQVKCFTQHH
jgi:Fe-S cluster assembly ATP-binding protein